jgi:hypothetical protein
LRRCAAYRIATFPLKIQKAASGRDRGSREAV